MSQSFRSDATTRTPTKTPRPSARLRRTCADRSLPEDAATLSVARAVIFEGDSWSDLTWFLRAMPRLYQTSVQTDVNVSAVVSNAKLHSAVREPSIPHRRAGLWPIAN